MTHKVYNVLFLCTGNSARSIFAELLMQRLGRQRFRGFSAGSSPKGEVDPMTLEVARDNQFETEGLRSKGWSEFAGADAPSMDFVFTVCDRAAEEACPVWPGQPITAHWGVADPTLVAGDHLMRKAAFNKAFRELQNRISIFSNLPLASLDRLKLQQELDAIGRVTLESDQADEKRSA